MVTHPTISISSSHKGTSPPASPLKTGVGVFDAASHRGLSKPLRYAVAVCVVTIGILCGTHSAHAQVNGSNSNAASSDLQGRSDVLELESYVPDTRLSDSVANLTAAEHNVRETAAHAASQIRVALDAFESQKTVEAEVQLYQANAVAIATQYDALGDYQQSLRGTAEILRGFASELDEALDDFAVQSEDTASRQQQRSQRASDARKQLEEMALRIDDLMGQDGQFQDPEVEAAVLTLHATLKGLEASSSGAGAEKNVIDADMEQLRRARTSLIRQTGVLQAAAGSIDTQRSFLTDAAKRQKRSLLRKVVLWRSADALKAIKDLKVLDIIQQIPVVASSQQTVAVDYELPDIGVKEILNQYRPELAKATEK